MASSPFSFEGTPNVPIDIFELTRTPNQIAALKGICDTWHTGVEQFWHFDSVLEAISRPGNLVLFCAESAEAIKWCGAAVVDVGPFTADLLYVYVRPEFRGKKLGHLLMNRLMQVLANKPQIEALFLEVRVSNIGAQQLYKSLGMDLIGVRKKYYSNGEDALIFKTSFSASAALGEKE